MRNSRCAFLLFALPLAGCASLGSREAPQISFTKVPSFGLGDPNLLEAIEGKVSGLPAGAKVVLYAKSQDWWIQPLADHPFTVPAADSTWKNQTHPGSAYAALLVKDGYKPNPRTGALPQAGGEVLAVATSANQGEELPFGKSILFSGFEWRIREKAASVAGGLKFYDAAHAWTDGNSSLHLKIGSVKGRLAGAEVSLRRSLGYGTYRFAVRDLSGLDPAAAFNIVTSDEDDPAREMNIEISKWGENFAKNGQFVIQPYHVPANSVQFVTPGGPVTFMMRWEPGRATFKVFRGAAARWDSPAVRAHVFSSGVPAPGKDSIHLHLYVFGNNAPLLRHENEVVVDAFEYLP